MSKIVIKPTNKKQIKLHDSIIVGVKNLSVGVLELTLEEINKLKNKEIFVSINKNIHNQDLPYLKEVLLNLKNIKGVIYYDVSIVNLKQELNLPYDLIWAQEHHTTNANTANFWFENNVIGTYISNDITLDEMINLINNYKGYTMVTLFGYLPIFVSKRPLISNYLKTFKLKNKKTYTINKEGKSYPILENNTTQVYSDFILNGLKESLILKDKVNYIVLDAFNIDKFKQVLKIFKEVNESNVLEYENKLNSMFNNLNKGFLYEETIYRVKK